jgi:hypothetical protein
MAATTPAIRQHKLEGFERSGADVGTEMIRLQLSQPTTHENHVPTRFDSRYHITIAQKRT